MLYLSCHGDAHKNVSCIILTSDLKIIYLFIQNRFLEDVELPDDVRERCVEMCSIFHMSTRELSEEYLAILRRHNYVTPTSYLELISTFKVLLEKKRNEVMKMKKRYEVGLEKLESASQQVLIN